jgi:hypothetical protein
MGLPYLHTDLCAFTLPLCCITLAQCAADLITMIKDLSLATHILPYLSRTMDARLCPDRAKLYQLLFGLSYPSLSDQY